MRIGKIASIIFHMIACIFTFLPLFIKGSFVEIVLLAIFSECLAIYFKID